MAYDFDFFDVPLSRPDSIKWTTFGKDVIPLWIADMDYRACEEVTKGLVARAQEGCFGYARESEAAIDAMIAWHEAQYGWKIERSWVVPQPGVVTSLHLFCSMLKDRNAQRDEVLVGEPVYHHFISAVREKQMREVRLVLNDAPPYLPAEIPQSANCGGWMFCNPENPLGYCWTKAELERVLALARANDWIIASDEIHGGLVLDAPYTYEPLLKVDPEAGARTMAFVAPSKTFNIPGLGCSFAILPNAEYRRYFTRDNNEGIPRITPFGWVGVEMVYRHGEAWRQGLLRYLRRNRALVEAWVGQCGLKMCPMGATYLAFVDCRSLPLHGESAKAFFLREAGVACHDGAIFGRPGYVRINIATQYALLAKALERMGNAIASLKQS